MPKGLTVCQNCGASMGTTIRVCPSCGTQRVPTKGAIYARRYQQKKTVACDICGEPVGQAGIGSHRSRMHGVTGEKAKYYKPVGSGRGEWTVSLVNGQKQIAAKVSDATAKRIIGMLF